MDSRRQQKPFECVVEGTRITGYVAGFYHELHDYAVEARIDNVTYTFELRLVSTPPLYVVPVLIRPGDRRYLVERKRMKADECFAYALTELVRWHRELIRV